MLSALLLIVGALITFHAGFSVVLERHFQEDNSASTFMDLSSSSSFNIPSEIVAEATIGLALVLIAVLLRRDKVEDASAQKKIARKDWDSYSLNQSEFQIFGNRSKGIPSRVFLPEAPRLVNKKMK